MYILHTLYSYLFSIVLQLNRSPTHQGSFFFILHLLSVQMQAPDLLRNFGKFRFNDNISTAWCFCVFRWYIYTPAQACQTHLCTYGPAVVHVIDVIMSYCPCCLGTCRAKFDNYVNSTWKLFEISESDLRTTADFKGLVKLWFIVMNMSMNYLECY